ncbi:hypothetical protein PENSPDRAFT_318818 [Peniophora sp. CONT]|nr:hypothetical protein PENSPDRAFT_318818 [Peniophora sp. CONT]
MCRPARPGSSHNDPLGASPSISLRPLHRVGVRSVAVTGTGDRMHHASSPVTHLSPFHHSPSAMVRTPRRVDCSHIFCLCTTTWYLHGVSMTCNMTSIHAPKKVLEKPHKSEQHRVHNCIEFLLRSRQRPVIYALARVRISR